MKVAPEVHCVVLYKCSATKISNSMITKINVKIKIFEIWYTICAFIHRPCSSRSDKNCRTSSNYKKVTTDYRQTGC